MEEVLKQYDLQVKMKKRIRGAFLLETNQGLFLLKGIQSGAPRIAFEERVKQALAQRGYDRTDRSVPNKKGELLTKDNYHNGWILRKWAKGNECNVRDEAQLLRGVAHLAKIHTIGKLGEVREGDYVQKENLKCEMERHNQELKRVRRYIRTKKQKNEMELCLLKSFDQYYEQGCLAEDFLRDSSYERVWEETLTMAKVRHGSYSYHNLLFEPKGIFLSNFEHTEIGIQICDFYDFLRKAMEKNGWKRELGLKMIQKYLEGHPTDEDERELFYAMLLYPEKYWKLINFYYNGKKVWMPTKNLEKLMNILKQEEQRRSFLKDVKTLLF